jgi:hypothetical protein
MPPLDFRIEKGREGQRAGLDAEEIACAIGIAGSVPVVAIAMVVVFACVRACDDVASERGREEVHVARICRHRIEEGNREYEVQPWVCSIHGMFEIQNRASGLRV